MACNPSAIGIPLLGKCCKPPPLCRAYGDFAFRRLIARKVTTCFVVGELAGGFGFYSSYTYTGVETRSINQVLDSMTVNSVPGFTAPAIYNSPAIVGSRTDPLLNPSGPVDPGYGLEAGLDLLDAFEPSTDQPPAPSGWYDERYICQSEGAPFINPNALGTCHRSAGFSALSPPLDLSNLGTCRNLPMAWCTIDSAAFGLSNYNVGIFASKLVAFVHGRYRVQNYLYNRTPTSSYDGEAPPLLYNSNGTLIWPQPLTPLIVPVPPPGEISVVLPLS